MARLVLLAVDERLRILRLARKRIQFSQKLFDIKHTFKNAQRTLSLQSHINANIHATQTYTKKEKHQKSYYNKREKIHSYA